MFNVLKKIKRIFLDIPIIIPVILIIFIILSLYIPINNGKEWDDVLLNLSSELFGILITIMFVNHLINKRNNLPQEILEFNLVIRVNNYVEHCMGNLYDLHISDDKSIYKNDHLYKIVFDELLKNKINYDSKLLIDELEDNYTLFSDFFEETRGYASATLVYELLNIRKCLSKILNCKDSYLSNNNDEIMIQYISNNLQRYLISLFKLSDYFNYVILEKT